MILEVVTQKYKLIILFKLKTPQNARYIRMEYHFSMTKEFMSGEEKATPISVVSILT